MTACTTTRPSLVAQRGHKSVPEVIAELWELLRDYAKQETLGPLKNLTGYLKFGVPGAVLVLTGVLFLAMGALRGMQRFRFTQYGWNSVWPYASAILVLLVAMAICIGVISRTRKVQMPNDGKLRLPDLDGTKEPS